MVEFVLVAPLLFLVVGGIIQFVLALNYWLDMQRIANQGARWAVVARYPLPDGTMCSASSPCATSPDEPNSLQIVLREEAQSEGLSPNVSICFPDAAASGAVGNPVRVRLESPFTFVPILGIGTVELGADAEMRIEQPPNNVYQATPCESAPPSPPPTPPPPTPPPPPSPPPSPEPPTPPLGS
jgi:hypothetical protein